MAYRGTDIKDLAKETAQAVIEAAAASDDTAYDIHIFLQSAGRHIEWKNGEPNEIPMYSVHCDRSYGGSEEAEQSVQERLPNALCIFVDGEHNPLTESEAVEAAWGKEARELSYDLDFATGVSLAIN